MNNIGLKGTLPWTRSCFVCGESNPHGLRLRSSVENGVVSLVYTTRESDLGWKAIVHGGITTTLLDEVMTWAAIIDAGRACVSVELTCRIKKAVRLNQKVTASGRVSLSKSRLILTEGMITAENGDILAEASGKFMPMPAGETSICEEDFVISPDAIHPSQIIRK